MTGAIQIYDADIYKVGGSQVNPGYNLGTIGFDEYGDLYRLVKAGASDLAKGKISIAPAPKANHHNIAAAAAVTADGRVKTVTLTLGATASVAQEYAQGLLCATDVAPEGEQYRITNQPATASSGTQTITVERPFLTSISTGSEFTLVHNEANAVVEAAVATRRVAGVTVVNVTAGYYAWEKVRGACVVLADGAITLGAQVCVSASVAGAAKEAADVTAPQAEVIIGAASILAAVDTEYRPINLTII